ncbi:MAG: double-strand break repair helicase AddA [Pararhodobacter sp.]|nr:double-strand break repair helicase AddA [Pararhodobacter sp.]
MIEHIVFDEATQRQIDAAAPELSTWLSANAGSGKTRVLTDRVARLLLRGANPQRVLCLTYTKAAAGEMQNRLFATLGEWAMLDDAGLARALAALGEDGADGAEVLARARRLFARAIETPGGLKIQTIHAFCSALLRRFPLEAGVSPDFTEIEERSLAQLQAELLNEMAEDEEAALLEGLAAAIGEDRLSSLLADIGRHRDAFAPGTPMPDLHALLGLPPGYDEAALLAEVFTGGEADMATALVTPISGSDKRGDPELGAALALLREPPSRRVLPDLEARLLFGAKTKAPFGSKAAKIPTKVLRQSLPADAIAALDALADRLADARPRRLALEVAERSAALHAFARAWLPRLDAAKAARGWLDFDDLIARAQRLMSRPDVAMWVLYKLDGGIDHILVDEAQDTSPGQWLVIERLTQEFTAGQGARQGKRTIFVVGDRKQSIYSFQGADLRGFDHMQEAFAEGLAGVGQRLNPMELQHSFRSSDAVLRLVDHCFADAGAAGGLGMAPQHMAFHPDLPGRVTLWPVIAPPERAEQGEWDDPLDRPSSENHEIQLARAIAAELRAMIESGEPILDGGQWRPMHAGDVMILVRRRKLLFHALIRACKAEGLEIAGADRLKLGEELAVQDIVALLRFLALPEDDLALAQALRSPLIGLSEDALFRLAHGRGAASLWQRVRASGGQVAAMLSDMLGQVDFLRPYELVERLLTRHDGRRRLRARFGAEAEEAIEAFVDLALRFEEGHVPSLDGFLSWLAASDVEVKRQVEGAGRRLRVMTVHGAKGLEAPVVVLPETADRVDQERAALTAPGGVPILRAGRKDDAPSPQREADDAAKGARAEESDRLLYVALTRARQWLIVAGAGKADSGASWHERVAKAMQALGAVACETPAGQGLHYAHGDWPAAAAPDGGASSGPAAPADLPAVATPPTAAALSPSALGGAKALPGEGGAQTALALARGSMIHLLLEHLPALPRGDWPEQANALLAAFDAPEVEALACIIEAMAILNDSSLEWLFAPEVLAEAALGGDWLGRPLWGAIDRLLVEPERVLAVDFKSNRLVPETAADTPEGLLRQMAAYAHLLRAIYPARRIETAILWTSSARLMPLDTALMEPALARAAHELGLN